MGIEGAAEEEQVRSGTVVFEFISDKSLRAFPNLLWKAKENFLNSQASPTNLFFGNSKAIVPKPIRLRI